MFQHANISCFSERTYQRIQQHYLVPAVERVWKAHQDALFDVIRRQNEALVVDGDERYGSPGQQPIMDPKSDGPGAGVYFQN